MGTLREGESATDPITLNLGSNNLSWGATTAGGGFSANVSWAEVSHTEDASVDVDEDGSYEINHVGTLSPGSIQTFDAPGLTRSTSQLGVATNNATEVAVEAQYCEVTQTENPTVEVNGHETSELGQLTDGETVQLDTDPSWINSGTNRINVSLGDGTLSADAPQSEVDLDYQHESVDNQTVQYTAQRWTERYNVSRTWLSDQTSASLTIPFKDTVLSIRDVEKRVGSNDWTELQSSDYALDGSRLTVQLGSINKNTEVGVRVNASRVRVNNGSIHVQEATEQGRKLDTQIAIDEWSEDSYIQLPQREDNLIAYAYNESWSGPTDEMRVTADGERRLRLPNALEGGQTRIATIPVEAAPETGDVVISVGQPSATEPKFVVQPGQTQGDDVDFTFTGAADGTDYILYSQSNGIVRDSGTAQSPLTLSDDDSDETLQFLVDEGEVGGPDDDTGGPLTLGNAPAVAVAQAQANPLGALLVAIIALTVLLGAYWAAKRRRRPRKGWLGDIASFVSTEVVLIGLSIIGIVAALRFNVLALPRPALFVGAVFGIELLGYLLLRYFGYFDWKIYGAASAIVAIASTQILVPEAVEQLLGSNALARTLPLVAAFGMYILYRAVEGWRRGQVTEIVVGGSGGDDQN
ncbi:hypothetical protein [Halorientalis persicus]|uniref:hypothetical protein n=1 Tax=Halorientalis persicus TaxID=1367881 RepID=UPI000B841A1E|nr:hypothetical protein [Halorientalis persicus]